MWRRKAKDRQLVIDTLSQKATIIAAASPQFFYHAMHMYRRVVCYQETGRYHFLAGFQDVLEGLTESLDETQAHIHEGIERAK
jgi:hypothetical protein